MTGLAALEISTQNQVTLNHYYINAALAYKNLRIMQWVGDFQLYFPKQISAFSRIVNTKYYHEPHFVPHFIPLSIDLDCPFPII